MEKYNKYGESLYLDCSCKDKKPIKKSNDCGCGGINLPSHSNEIEILIRQLKREVAELLETTQAKLLCQDKKIAETMVYIKNNLSNYIRDLLDSMLESGELDEIITSVIENSIEVLESDVETLKADMTRAKANIDYINNELANKLGFDEVAESDVNSKFLDIDVATEYVNDSIVYITKLTNIDKIACLPTNGDVSADVNLNKKNVIDYSKTDTNYDVYINGGMSGIYFFDGSINQTTRLDCPYYCCLDADNNMKFYEGLSQTITPDQLLVDGVVNCFSGFAPLIVDHALADYSSLEAIASTNAIAQAFIDSLPVKHPRQILAQDDDNNFYIISIMGRFNNSDGMNYPEMKNYCLAKGYKNAFNCDGGGSMQTIINQNYVFYPSQELDTNVDRLIPSVLGFKLKGVE